MNEFLNAEQRIRLACVLKIRREYGDYGDSKFCLTLEEIMFVLDEKTDRSALDQYIKRTLKQKIVPRLKRCGYDGSEFSQEVLQ